MLLHHTPASTVLLAALSPPSGAALCHSRNLRRHDLNSDVLSVSMAATRVVQSDMEEIERAESAMFLQRAVSGLSGMLGELMELARLEAGQEERRLTHFDVVELIAKLCEGDQSFAIERSQLSQ